MEEKYITVNARIPESQYDMLNKYAKDDYSNISVLIRQAVGEFISRRENKQD